MRTARTIAALSTLALLMGCASEGFAQQGAGGTSGLVVRAENQEPTLSVTSQGRVEAPADEVTIVLSVVTEMKSVDEAVRDNNRRSKDVADALTRLQLGENAVTTSGFRVTPQYQWDRNTGRQLGITGYQVSNTVQVKTSKIDQAGRVVEAGINAGANEVVSMVFGLRAPETIRRIAIRDAVQTARAEADAAADAANLRITGIRTLSIQPDFGRPMYRMEAARSMAADAGGVGETPTNPGLIEVTANVTIEYRIEPR
jgi:uncharacterized protein YggE